MDGAASPLSLSRDALVAALTGLEPALRAEGVTSLALFGSRARGDNRADSDIDLLIEVDKERPFSLLNLIGVAHVVQDGVGGRADIVMRRSLEPRFRGEVDADQVMIFQ